MGRAVDPTSKGGRAGAATAGLWATHALFAALLALHALPVALSKHLPMQDLPAHLGIVATLARRDIEPGWGEHFVDRLGFSPYAGYYGVTLALAKVLGVVGANKAVLLAYVVGTPLSFAFAARELGGTNRWAHLAGFLLIYSDFYLLGFTNMLLASPVSLVGLGLATRSARAPSAVAPLAGLVVVGLMLFALHPSGLALLALVIAVVVPCRGPWRGALPPLLALVPGAALTAIELVNLLDGPMPITTLGPATKAVYLLVTPLLAAEASWRPAFVVAAVALAVALADAAKAARDASWRPLESTLPAAAALALAFCLLPFGAGAVVWLDARCASWCWVLLLLAPGPRLAGGLVGKGALLTAIVASFASVARGHASFQREIEAETTLLARAPGGALLWAVDLGETLAFRPFYARWGDVPWFSHHAHVAGYYHVEHGGLSPFMTFHPSLEWVPLGLRDRRLRPLPITLAFDREAQIGALVKLAPAFDLVLVRGEQARAAAAMRGVAEVVDRIDDVTLYRPLVSSRPGATPGAGR